VKHRPWDNSFGNTKYEKYIRSNPCIVNGCCNRDVILHHVHHARNNSYMGVPLCNYHHTVGPAAYHVLEHGPFEDHHKLNLDWTIQKLLMQYIEETR